jgi:hypothetical protein
MDDAGGKLGFKRLFFGFAQSGTKLFKLRIQEVSEKLHVLHHFAAETGAFDRGKMSLKVLLRGVEAKLVRLDCSQMLKERSTHPNVTGGVPEKVFAVEIGVVDAYGIREKKIKVDLKFPQLLLT